MAEVEFWYEFASTYSYPAAMRIGGLAAARGVFVRWRPFLLGPLFAESGWRDSPFNIYPVKGRYMWRDLERICASLGLPLVRPNPFPQNSLAAARIAVALDDGPRAEFSRLLYRVEFGEGRQISDRAVLASLLSDLALDPEAIFAKAESGENKALLKAEVGRATALGLPGAPSLVTEDGEVFWGNDRLEQGFDWASGKR
ncbi:MAG: 2-hydroxychromene-2-carboxylate isomerase [Roseiarcus sp.]